MEVGRRIICIAFMKWLTENARVAVFGKEKQKCTRTSIGLNSGIGGFGDSSIFNWHSTLVV